MNNIDQKNILVANKSYSRNKDIPLDTSEIISSHELAEEYVNSPISYAGQTIKVYDNGKYYSYTIQQSNDGRKIINSNGYGLKILTPLTETGEADYTIYDSNENKYYIDTDNWDNIKNDIQLKIIDNNIKYSITLTKTFVNAGLISEVGEDDIGPYIKISSENGSTYYKPGSNTERIVNDFSCIFFITGDISKSENVNIINIGDHFICKYTNNEGIGTKVFGEASHVEGKDGISFGARCHVEGWGGIAYGNNNHVEGYMCIAKNSNAHAEGNRTMAEGNNSHTEGGSTHAFGYDSHAEGRGSSAYANYSHAEGYYTIASGDNQHVQGKYNIEDTNNEFAHIVGNGTSTNRSNAHTIDWNGNAWFAGDIRIKGTTAKDNVLTLNSSIFASTFFESNFNDINIKTVSSRNFDNVVGTDNSDTYKIGIGGSGINTENFSIVDIDSESCLQFEHKAGSSISRMKFFNVIKPNNAPMLTDDDIGKVIKISAEVRAADTNIENSIKFKYGLMSLLQTTTDKNYATNLYNTAVIDYVGTKPSTIRYATNTWETIEFTVKIDKTMVDNQIGLFTIETSNNGIIYIRNIKSSMSVTLDEVISNNNLNDRDDIGEKGLGINAEIFNDYSNNSATGDYSHVEGSYNNSGSKSFKFNLSHDYSLDIIDEQGNGKYYLTDITGIEPNMEYTLVLKDNYDYQGKIVSIGTDEILGSYIVVTNWIQPNIIENDPNQLSENSYIIFPEYPELGTDIIGTGAHTEGYNNKASSVASHAEGYSNIAAGKYSHVEGRENIAVYAAHAEGQNNSALAYRSHVEGYNNITRGQAAHAEGKSNIAEGQFSHAEGQSNTVSGYGAHIEGISGISSGKASHAEGQSNKAIGEYSHVEGWESISSGLGSHAEGRKTESTGEYTHSEGSFTKAQGNYSHAEGRYTISIGDASHAEGFESNASGNYSHAEGNQTIASANYSHTEGDNTKATGVCAHAEGRGTTAGYISHAEGLNTKATGNNSHSEGYLSQAIGKNSHSEGSNTIASGDNQHVQGKYNIEDTNNEFAHIVGNGTSTNRSNAHTIDWNGNAWFAGNVETTGIIMTSPNGTRYLIEITDNGEFVSTKIE